MQLGSSLGYLDEVAQQYAAAPEAVDASWAALLGEPVANGHANGHAKGNGEAAHADTPWRFRASRAPGPSRWRRSSRRAPRRRCGRSSTRTAARGHFAATLDPLGLIETAHVDELDPATWGFTDPSAIDRRRPASTACRARTLAELIARLRARLRRLRRPRVHAHLHRRRGAAGSPSAWRRSSCKPLPAAVRARMLCSCSSTPSSSSGSATPSSRARSGSRSRAARALIPALDLDPHPRRAARRDRGRDRHGAPRPAQRRSSRSSRSPARELFAQFEDIEPEKAIGGGDVKYHLGYSTDRVDPDGQRMHVSLAFNPSHLESVDPVVDGRVRAKQTRHGDVEHRRVLGVLVHGDAAFMGQGLVPETLQLSGPRRAIARAARSTSSSTTRSASPRRPRSSAPRRTAPTSRRCSSARSCT